MYLDFWDDAIPIGSDNDGQRIENPKHFGYWSSHNRKATCRCTACMACQVIKIKLVRELFPLY